MSIGFFTDKKYQPSESEVLEAVGSRRKAWETLISYIRDGYAPTEDFKFLYGKNYGWAYRFQIKGQVLASLYPTLGGFTVQVNLSEAGVQEAREQALGSALPRAIDAANPYPEGRWLFVPVETENDLKDIYKLIELRAKEKRLPSKV